MILLNHFSDAVQLPYDIMIYSTHAYIEPAPDAVGMQIEFISTVKIKVKLLFLVSNVCRPQGLYKTAIDHCYRFAPICNILLLGCIHSVLWIFAMAKCLLLT